MTRSVVLLSLPLLAAGACGGRRTVPIGDSGVPTDQWSSGVVAYGNACAGCHGEEGEGDEESPKLKGAGSLPEAPREGSDRTEKLTNAKELHDYIARAMPPIAPGTLSASEYWAITAYVLKSRGAKLPDTLGADNAASIPIPR